MRFQTRADSERPLKVVVAGGGPVGLSFALMLAERLKGNVEITIYDGRWSSERGTVEWCSATKGNVRRQQVVTIQSRQFLRLPSDVQELVFAEGRYSEMWPAGPDSVNGLRPRNLRIAHFEDRLLERANGKGIKLVPSSFDPTGESIGDADVVVIAEGAQSRTRDYFLNRFGRGDESPYSVHGTPLSDVVLGMRVVSDIPSEMSVMLTIAQNRFLLNSHNGQGFLNMRLTDAEAAEVIGIDLQNKIFAECIQSRPCLMERCQNGEYACQTHGTLFVPALRKDTSPLWQQMKEGLKLYGIREENFSAVSAFRLSMVHRPKFTAVLKNAAGGKAETYGFLIGDAANAIHFWPGRGLNCGLASAYSLAATLAARWTGRQFRDADFMRHEANMHMLQFRHKARAWRAMVAPDAAGTEVPIKTLIADGLYPSAPVDAREKGVLIGAMMGVLENVRTRLEGRIGRLPSAKSLERQLSSLSATTLRAMVASGPWDATSAGGEEVDVEWLAN